MLRWMGQVIAPLLIIRRVANRSVLTGETISVRTISFGLGSRGESTGDAPPGVDPISLVDEYGKNSGEAGVRVESTIDLHQGDPYLQQASQDCRKGV